jgi:hypothetical protein
MSLRTWVRIRSGWKWLKIVSNDDVIFVLAVLKTPGFATRVQVSMRSPHLIYIIPPLTNSACFSPPPPEIVGIMPAASYGAHQFLGLLTKRCPYAPTAAHRYFSASPTVDTYWNFTGRWPYSHYFKIIQRETVEYRVLQPSYFLASPTVDTYWKMTLFSLLFDHPTRNW